MKTSRLVALVASALVIGGCGSSKKDKTTQSGEDSGPAELVRVPVQVAEDRSELELLDGASQFDVALAGCASGFTSAIDATDSSLVAYNGDRGCLAKLTAFEVNGARFVPSSADPFTTWLAGDVAIFEEETAPSSKVRVVVALQLSSPVLAADAVEYRYSEIAAGPDEDVDSGVVGGSHAIQVAGQAAPEFSIATVAFDGIDTNGAGQFIFALECSATLTGTGAARACKDVRLANLSYKLVEDTYSGVLTSVQADAIFATPGTSIDMTSDVVAPGATLPMGGFNTKSGTSVLRGPNQMHLHPGMLLVLRVGPSYQYFEVDVSILSQP